MDGDNWKENTNWLVPGKPIDQWFGVTTTPEGCVQSLTLYKNNLTGTLYDLQLNQLSILHIGQNNISGEIPDFSGMPNLEQLIMYTMKLYGNIPDFSNMLKLTDLHLSSNQLTGHIPDFSYLPKLTFLVLARNELTGNIVDFTKLPELLEYKIYDNKLSGEIPDFIHLPNLSIIWFGGNNFTGQIPDFSNLPDLIALFIERNYLTGEIPNFSKLPKLQAMGFEDNQLTGTIPDFANLPELYYIRLFQNGFSGSIPDFNNLPKLTTLLLFDNDLENAIPSFTNLPELTELDLSNNNLTGEIPNFANAVNFTKLRLSQNRLNGKIPDYTSSTALTSLRLYYNNYTFQNILESGNLGLPEFLYSPQNLFYTDTTFYAQKDKPFSFDLGIDESLNSNQYTWKRDGQSWIPPAPNTSNSNDFILSSPATFDAGRYVATVTNPTLPFLTLNSKTISLKVCDILSDSLELVKLYEATNGSQWVNHTNWLQLGKPFGTWHGIATDSFGCVRKIDLSQNNLTGPIPPLELNTLDTLLLRTNSLTGPIPNLNSPFIKSLGLADNDLIGGMPNIITSMVNLQSLDISSNAITGAIPPELGDLCELSTLRVNGNQFTGELPEELTLLTNLKAGQVDFSENDIDSLGQKIIWFCPFGDTILQKNPSYDRFLGICNIQCTGKEWDDLESYPWIQDTLGSLDCNPAGCESHSIRAGFVSIRGVNVFFTQSKCYITTSPPLIFDHETIFYDCGGHLLETVNTTESDFTTAFGGLSEQDFQVLIYDTRWICGQSLDINTAIEEPHIDLLPELQHVDQIDCSPNPANTWITCGDHFDIRPTSIRILDMMGRTYPTTFQVQNQQITLDVHHLQAGVYFVAIQGTDARYFSKIIVQ